MIKKYLKKILDSNIIVITFLELVVVVPIFILLKYSHSILAVLWYVIVMPICMLLGLYYLYYYKDGTGGK